MNLKGPFRLTAVMGPRMAAAGFDWVLDVTSMAAVTAAARRPPLCRRQGGPERPDDRVRPACRRADVRVNAIMAGAFLTDVSESWDIDASPRRAEALALWLRGGRPDEIVGAVMYLASDAASYTTGAIVQVDGGQP